MRKEGNVGCNHGGINHVDLIHVASIILPVVVSAIPSKICSIATEGSNRVARPIYRRFKGFARGMHAINVELNRVRPLHPCKLWTTKQTSAHWALAGKYRASDIDLWGTPLPFSALWLLLIWARASA